MHEVIELETVGPLELLVLETLCGKFNKGPWPPSDASYARASGMIEGAGGGRLNVTMEQALTWDDDDVVNAFAALAREYDEKRVILSESMPRISKLVPLPSLSAAFSRGAISAKRYRSLLENKEL